MENKLKCKVIILPSNEIGNGAIFVDSVDQGCLVINPKNTKVNRKDCEYKHLYLVSDREIKEGDWFINANTEQVDQYNTHSFIEGSMTVDDKKIEASTDSSFNDDIKVLNREYVKALNSLLPVIPDSFVEKYVNHQGNIEEVYIDMENYFIDDKLPSLGTTEYFKAKTNPDKTCIICPDEKQTFTREEVEAIIARMSFTGIKEYEEITKGCCTMELQAKRYLEYYEEKKAYYGGNY
jgi:hypothetical protein